MTTPALQASLFGETGPVTLHALAPRRTELGSGAWIDVRPGWVRGADLVFAAADTGVPWQAERRQMYDRVVDVPRLLCFYDEATRCPIPPSARRGGC